MTRVANVLVLNDYRVHLTFTDGTTREFDLAPFLNGPIFQPLRDPARFREVEVDEELGTLVWPNGADICPDVLYHGRVPASLDGSPR